MLGDRISKKLPKGNRFGSVSLILAVFLAIILLIPSHLWAFKMLDEDSNMATAPGESKSLSSAASNQGFAPGLKSVYIRDINVPIGADAARVAEDIVNNLVNGRPLKGHVSGVGSQPSV